MYTDQHMNEEVYNFEIRGQNSIFIVDFEHCDRFHFLWIRLILVLVCNFGLDNLQIRNFLIFVFRRLSFFFDFLYKFSLKLLSQFIPI